MSPQITLGASMLVPLRTALYSRLAICTDALHSALTDRGREQTNSVHAVYKELHTVGVLLDRAGWLDRSQKATFEVKTPAEALLITQALADELRIEQGIADNSSQYGEHTAAKASQERAQALWDTLDAIRTAASATGLFEPPCHPTKDRGQADG